MSEDESNDSAFTDNGKFSKHNFYFIYFCPCRLRINIVGSKYLSSKFFFFYKLYFIFGSSKLDRLWYPQSQNRVFGVGLNRVSIQNTRPKTIHWAEVFFLLTS